MVDKKDKDKIADLTIPTKRIIGVDCGTMNTVCAVRNDDGEIETTTIRNVYLPIDKSEVSGMDLSQMTHVETEDMIYIIGEDAYRYANIFGSPVKRPMSKGLISAEDIDSIDVAAMMMERLVGKTTGGLCVYSVPAASVDRDNDIIYHQNVYKRIFSEMGYTAIPLNEAMAIIYAECADDNFTGLAFSYGAGMSNVCMSYKGNPVLSFSVARGGDWIDDSVAKQFGTVSNRITSIKENNTDLSNFREGKKKERLIREAIVYYYTDLIRYTIDVIKKKLSTELADVDLPDEVPIIVSGGTSMAKGFIDLFKSLIENDDDIPFDIKSIKYAQDPLSSVAEGMLLKAMAEGDE
jgi:hypothetical protein